MALRPEPDTSRAPNPSKSGQFAEGVALFNAGEYFRAHEVWEELWLASSGKDKVFLQGLIQSAAAFHHHNRGNFPGAASLLKGGCAKLGELPDNYWGINLSNFRDSLVEWQTAMENNRKRESQATPKIRFLPV